MTHPFCNKNVHNKCKGIWRGRTKCDCSCHKEKDGSSVVAKLVPPNPYNYREVELSLIS